MKGTPETIEQFYKHKYDEDLCVEIKKNTGQFGVFRVEDRIRTGTTSPSFIRRNFFKIMLLQGDSIFHYGDKSIPVTGNTLLFFNPHIPYTYEPLSLDSKGIFCVFSNEFLNGNFRLDLLKLPLFTTKDQPVFSIKGDDFSELKAVFEKIIKEADTDYVYKYELIKHYLCELIYYGMKLKPIEYNTEAVNAAYRITSVFMELLERQFPIELKIQRFEFRLPKTFADQLSIHVNYLNRCIKKQTGRTTTDHIAERLISEAKALLKYTKWDISEISYVLGFEEQSHFTNFFKKYTNITPGSFRQV
ncbi:AraC family transcriptional regulator [Sphingobacterium siyangense]|jgi:AraC-like DNA-binding protein|uniref:AraC family transcriptional regulator n=1 Tax=Sphingobacterium siyangense TaxID=459529 RepID=UPI0028AC2141|nr:AraC family transcriptional regulator [Sphingobacterium siyangense]